MSVRGQSQPATCLVSKRIILLNKLFEQEKGTASMWLIIMYLDEALNSQAPSQKHTQENMV